MIRRLTLCRGRGFDPYENLALEAWLMDRVEAGECILYLWRNRRTVVIGRNQNSLRECRLETLQADGGQLARRLSGGGAVFHDLGNLNFSFLVQDPDYDVSRQLSVLLLALASFGIRAEPTGRNDVTVAGRKCSGSAFLRQGERHCHHGTVLIGVEGADMARYLTPDPGKLAAKGVTSVKARVVNLNTLCPTLTPAGMEEAMAAAFGQVYGLAPQPLDEAAIDWEAVSRRAAALADPRWLLGRDGAATFASSLRRFGWGSGELQLTVTAGRVSAATLYTDALDETLPRQVAAALTGVTFGRGALAEALRSAPLPPGVGEDLCQLIDEVNDDGRV